MKKPKILRKLLVFFLLTFPMIMLLGTLLINNAQARQNIPNLPDPFNNWHWHDDVKAGALIIYETEYRLNTPQGAMYSRFVEMMNITGFENKTRDFMGPGQLFSNVLAQQVYYNVTSKSLEVSPFSFNISSFQFNSARPPGAEAALLLSENQWMPSIVPINGTAFDATIMESVLFLTYFIAGNLQGQMNTFDDTGSNPAENRVWFTNSSDNYYINCTFFDNGTLNVGEAFIGVNNGMGGFMDAYVRYERVFDYNVTEEIEWGFNKGDIFYYGKNDLAKEASEYSYDELKIEIVDIATENVLVSFMYDLMQYYQVVYANVSYWNWTTEEYDLKDSEVVIGMANDIMPINLMEVMGNDLSRSKGELLETNLQVTAHWDYDFTVGPLPNNNNNTWGRKLIEMLDGFNGDPTGVYFIIDHVVEDMAGPSPDLGNLTIVLDQENMRGTLNDYAYGQFENGQYFNIFNISESEGPLFMVYPKDLTQEDLQFVFNNDTVKMMGFEEVVYTSENEIIMRNASAGTEINSKIDFTTGLAVYWMSNFEESQSVMYRKNSTIITTGNLYDKEMGGAERKDSVTAQLNVTVNGVLDAEVYWALLDFNPSLKPLERELKQMPIYFEVYSNNSWNVSWRNITICYDETILNNLNIPEANLSLFYFDNESLQWFESGKNYYTIDTTNNKIYIPIPRESPQLFVAVGVDKAYSWAVKKGDMLKLRTEGTFHNGTTDIPILDFTVYNITAIDTDGKALNEPDPPVYHDYTMEYIKQTQLVWNLTHWQIIEDVNKWSIITFGENNSDSIPLKIVPGVYAGGVPYIVPLRYGVLNLTEVATALMDSFYIPFGAEYGIPYWNDFEVDEVKNLISFTNNSGYWLNLTYFENNGTLQEASAFMTLKIDQIYEMEFTLDRNYVNSQSSTVSWGVEVGDILYYGSETEQKKFEVREINTTLVDLSEAGIMPWTSYQTFSTVWANKWVWNSSAETWDSKGITLIGVANDRFFGPYGNLFGAMGVSNGGDIALLKDGTTGTDIANQVMEYRYLFPEMDTIVSSSTDHYRITGVGGYYLENWINSTMGIIDCQRGRMRFGFFSIYRNTNYSMPTPGLYSKQDTFNGMTFKLDFTVTNSVDYYYRFFNPDANPVRTTNGIVGTIIFFSGMTITNQTRCSGTSTITLPTSIDLDNVYIRIWTYNSSTELWTGPSIDEILGFSTIDYVNNKITMTLPSTGPLSMISAWSWVERPSEGDDDSGDDKKETAPLEIAGYDALFLFTAIALTSLVIIKKRFR